jgi:hypothetical protein
MVGVPVKMAEIIGGSQNRLKFNLKYATLHLVVRMLGIPLVHAIDSYFKGITPDLAWIAQD